MQNHEMPVYSGGERETIPFEPAFENREKKIAMQNAQERFEEVFGKLTYALDAAGRLEVMAVLGFNQEDKSTWDVYHEWNYNDPKQRTAVEDKVLELTGQAAA